MYHTSVTTIKENSNAETSGDQLETKETGTPSGNITEKSTSDDNEDADDEYLSAEESSTSTPRSGTTRGELFRNSSKAQASARTDALTDDVELVQCLWDMADIGARHSEATRHLRHVVRFLRACGFLTDDIVVIFAHASIYFDAVKGKCKPSDVSEILNIMMLLMYIAHSYVQDQHCPLHCWHNHLFRKYCTLKTLNRAVISVMKLRGYVLRVDDVLLRERCDRLQAAALTLDASEA